MAINSEVPAVDVRVVRARDIDQTEERRLLTATRKAIVGIKSAESSAAANATLTAAQVLNGFLNTTAAATITFPTAAALVAGLPGAVVGDTFTFYVANTAAAAVTTLAGGTGGTVRGNLSIPALKSAQVAFTLTNVTAGSEAYLAYTVVGA